MFDRFSDNARAALNAAWEAAGRVGHDLIAPEHILLGLLRGDGLATDILANLGADSAELRTRIESKLTPGPAPSLARRLPFSTRARAVLEFALQEAFDFGHGHVGTEHLLVGLLREQGIAANALAAAGIDLGAVTKQLPARGPAAEAAGLERSPFSRFTDRSRQAMGLARVHSLRLNHDYIDTGHMLLGLLDEGSGVAADVLKALRVDPEVIRSGVQRLVSPGPTRVTQKQLPFTPAAKRALEFTLEEARGLGHDYLGTEHLLLGLIRERKGSAARVLASLGVSYEDARRTVVELLGPPGPPV